MERNTYDGLQKRLDAGENIFVVTGGGYASQSHTVFSTESESTESGIARIIRTAENDKVVVEVLPTTPFLNWPVTVPYEQLTMLPARSPYIK